MKRFLIFLFPLFASAQTVPITATQTNPITFTLPNARWTSIGLFNAQNQLVKTVAANRYYAKGKHTVYTSIFDDDGNVLTGTYKAKILSDSVLISPIGGIGNSSDSLSGSTVWHGYSPPTDMVQVGRYVYTAIGKNEAGQSIVKFDTLHPGQKINIPYNGTITGQTINNLATDQNLVYIAVTGYLGTDNFVYAINPSTDREATFSSGTAHTSYAVRNYASVFDLNNSAVTGNTTGMAVQQTGAYLFVATSGLNVINVFNKTTGALVRSISISAPGKLHLETDTKLWIGEGMQAQSFTVNSDGSLTSATLTITGLQRVSAISHKGSNLYVEDAGTNQQIFIYNSTTGASVGTLLQAGGYVHTSVVASDRVYIEDLHGPYATFITFLSDGTMWTGDPGNYRALHFNSIGNYQNQIMYMGVFYSCNAIGTRIFGNFLEFSYNYSNGAWALTNNYGYALPTTYNSAAVIYTYEPMQVFTMSNSGTYCIWRNQASQSFFGELTSTGFTPFSTVLPQGLTNNPDGTFSAATLTGTVQTWKGYALTGYTGRQPILSGSPTTLASYNIGTLYPRAGNALSSSASFVKTSTNKLVILSPNYSPSRPTETHLALYDLTHSRFAAKTAYNTFLAYSGPFPSNSQFDNGNKSQAQANSAVAIGNIVAYGYHGEFWKGGQTNFINLFDESGLMIAQGGTSVTQATTEAALGLTGNTLVLNMTSNGGNLYTFEGDESRGSRICVYRVSGLGTIHIDSTNITISNRPYVIPANNRIDLTTGLTENAPLTNGANGWTRTPATDNANFTTLVRRNESDMSKSPDVYVKSNNTTGNYSITRTLPGIVATNWELQADIDLSIAPFQNVMSINLNDVNGKVLARFSFIAAGATLNFNGSLIKAGFPAYTTYTPMKIELQRAGGGLYLLATINGVTYQKSKAIFDGTGNVARPGSVSVNFNYTGGSAGPGVDLGGLWFNWQ